MGYWHFFLAKALLHRYYMWKNYSKNFGAIFLGTIFWLSRAKFCYKVVLCQFFRYHKAGKASCDP
jgi:hypothetical protein